MTAPLRLPPPPRRDSLESLDAYDWREYDAERAEYHALADLRTPAGAADAVRIWQEDGQPDALLSLLLLHRLRWRDTRSAADQRETFATLDALCGQIERHYVAWRAPRIAQTFGAEEGPRE